MEWWQVVLVILLTSFVLIAIAAFVVWRLASAQTRRIAGRVQRLSWRARLKLARALMDDERIPLPARVIPALLVLYLSLPLDIVPDFIPVVGQIDDVLVVAVGVGLMLKLTPLRIIESHLSALEDESPQRASTPIDG